MASIEGKRGTPRPRPPYPGRGGPVGLPDADQQRRDVRQRARRSSATGADWFAGIGTEKSKGTKVFCPGRQGARTPAWSRCRWARRCGRSSRRSAAASPDGGTIKAVQTGGPSGGCIPAEHLDTPVDYESLAQLGSIMGSGGMIVMDQDDEHGGRGPLLHGVLHGRVVRQVHPLPRRHRADAPAADPDRRRAAHAAATWRQLEALCDMVKHTSLCGLGQTAPNPVLSTLRYFRDEYEALLDEAETASADGRRLAAWARQPHDRLDQLRHAGESRQARRRMIMAVKTLTIDGKLISAREDETLLDGGARGRHRASRRCATSTALSDVGACRLCLVEVDGSNRLLPACVTDGRRGHGRPDRHRPSSREYRRMIVELLFAERNHICSVCVANGNCELQDLAVAVGMDHVRFDYLNPHLRRRHQPRAVRRRPQPLHPLHPLRAGLRRDRGGAHLGRRRPRHQRAGDHRPEPAVGRRRRPAPRAASACRPARPGRSSARARPSPRWSTTATMLAFLVTAREKKQWNV